MKVEFLPRVEALQNLQQRKDFTGQHPHQGPLN